MGSRKVSYVSVVAEKTSNVRTGGGATQQDVSKPQLLLELTVCDFVIEYHGLKFACFGKARDYLTLLNLSLLCFD